MNRNMNLPAIQRIAMEFERENDMMDQRQEMMDDAIDDTFEDEEEESDEIVNQVLDEIGIDLSQSVFTTHFEYVPANFYHSLGKPLRVPSTSNLAPLTASHKLLVLMMTCKLVWIV
jgi:Snf7